MNKFSAYFDYTQYKQKGFVNLVLIGVGGIILVAIVIFIASGALKFKGSISKNGGQPPSSQPSSATKTYQNKDSGISLEYPEGWSIKENPAAGVIVAFGSPKESNSDTFVDNVNVSISDLSSKPDMTLNQVSDLWQKQTEEDLAAGAFKLSEIKPDTLAGQDAKRLVYSYNKEGKDIKGMVVIALKDNKAYIVTYTAEKGSFDKFVNAANAIVTSLQVK